MKEKITLIFTDFAGEKTKPISERVKVAKARRHKVDKMGFDASSLCLCAFVPVSDLKKQSQFAK